MAVAKKLAAVILIVACAVAAFSPPAAMGAAYSDPPVKEGAESCPTQVSYFKNCLGYNDHVDREGCCSVVQNPKCLCLLEKQIEVPCVKHRRAASRPCPAKGALPPKVNLAELQQLSCFKNLKC